MNNADRGRSHVHSVLGGVELSATYQREFDVTIGRFGRLPAHKTQHVSEDRNLPLTFGPTNGSFIRWDTDWHLHNPKRDKRELTEFTFRVGTVLR